MQQQSSDQKRRWPEGLVIRARRPEDAEQSAKLHNLPGYRHGTLRPPHPSPESVRKYIEANNPNNLSLVAVLDGLVVGEIGLTRFQDRRNHAGSLGMGVHDDYTGRGIGRAMLSEVVEAADQWFNLARLELTVYTDNARAIALYESFGFEREGHLRMYAFRAGRHVDAYSMARLRA